jgi:hypothetical protein
MLNRLKAQAGHWHDLAKLLPALASLGADATVVEAETGIERAMQNAWSVSLQVPWPPLYLCSFLEAFTMIRSYSS